MTPASYPRIAALKTAAAFREHLARHNIGLPFDDELVPPSQSPLASGLVSDGVTIGNRFAVLPMEGWDGELDGRPSELTTRRWRRFGQSGAKLIWGGEAVAVRHDGRASPRQLQLTTTTESSVARLRQVLVDEHRERFGANADGDLVIGLQLTHSGRFSKPDDDKRPAPLAACQHPAIDQRFSTPPHVLSDAEIDQLIADFVEAARRAHRAGFDFIDFKHCHGYLAHDLLGARSRAGRYGGSFENRTRFMREVIEAIRTAVPGLRIAVRLSAADLTPFTKDANGVGTPAALDAVSRQAGFGLLASGDLDEALSEPRALLTLLRSLGVTWICTTLGSPYYTPHVIRPAYFPPMDGYLPPEDPLVGVARHVAVTAALKRDFPDMLLVGSGYSYLQEWLAHVAQAVITGGMADVIGLGRLMLSYPEFPSDVLSGAPLRRGAFCRTFSDCTTGPRLGLVSGCYPLDEFYRARPDAETVLAVRTGMKR